MEVLVAYESRRGGARRAARAIADAAADRGIATLVRSVAEVKPGHVRAADALVAGCWTRASVPFGGEPTQHMVRWIGRLPPLDGKPVGVFCTYSFLPHTFADTAARTAETQGELTQRFQLRGAKVVASRSLHIRSLQGAAARLIVSVTAHVPVG